ncbi:MAG TPA: hypothetical protein VD788_00195 [Candidatus Polarisedimenticolaceae bacterium]|nr:hypothetical protein [Candidatus Polarisedimenticolaceae bacterium]
MQTVSESQRLIAMLNAIDVGELDGIRAKLASARQACIRLDQVELADRLHEAERALFEADLKTYRKRIATVIARLGHLKE